MATRPAPEPLITRNQITARVGELAARLSDDALASPPILLIVLKGSVYFGADLARAMTVPVEIEFIRANSYDGTSSTGGAKLSTEPAEPLTGRSVFIVEDILATGVRASRLV